MLNGTLHFLYAFLSRFPGWRFTNNLCYCCCRTLLSQQSLLSCGLWAPQRGRRPSRTSKRPLVPAWLTDWVFVKKIQSYVTFMKSEAWDPWTSLWYVNMSSHLVFLSFSLFSCKLPNLASHCKGGCVHSVKLSPTFQGVLDYNSHNFQPVLRSNSLQW